MTHLNTEPPDPAAMDRAADLLLAEGRHAQAERLAHQAAEFRRRSVLEPRRAMAAFIEEVAR